MGAEGLGERRSELGERLAAVLERIEKACHDAGRDSADDPVSLVVVTKTFPASDVRLLAELGVQDVGENRDQEAKAKFAELGDVNLRWHMIGRLQRNKAASVAGWADVVESVDRPELVDALDAAVARGKREPLDVLVQVNLDPIPEPARGGVAPDGATELAEKIVSTTSLRLAGVMAVAPHPDTGVEPSAAFARLREVADRIQRQWPAARTISAGMSHDLEAAVSQGATQVRVGGAILGERPRVQ